MEEDDDRYRSPFLWIVLMVIGALGVIPGCLAFSMLLSHPNLAHTTDRIVNPALFFGSLLLVVIGFIGYVRWKLNQ